jgi:hypothetical protein
MKRFALGVELTGRILRRNAWQRNDLRWGVQALGRKHGWNRQCYDEPACAPQDQHRL